MEYGGYDYDFVDTPPERFLCKICQCPSRDPYMTMCCGHPFCKSCLDQQKRTRTVVDYVCPICRDADFKTVFYIALNREVRELRVYCTNKGKGCKWKGEINYINDHLGNSDGCQFEGVNCSNECGKMIERQYLTSHVETECPRRKVNCQYCHDTGEHQFIEGQHKEECPKLPLPCPNKCEVGSVPRNDMKSHMKKCPLQIVECDYYSVGCQFRMTRKDQKKHKQENMEQHLMMTQTKLIEIQRLLQTTFDNQLLDVKKDLSTDLLEVKNQLVSTVATKAELSATNNQVAIIDSMMHQTANKLEVIKRELFADVTLVKEQSVTSRQLDNINNALSATNNELYNTRNQLSATNDALTTTKRKLEASVYELSVNLSTVNEKLSRMNQELCETKYELFAAKTQLAAIAGNYQGVDKVTRGFHERFEMTSQSLEVIQGQISDVKKSQESQQKAQLDQWILRLYTLSISGDKTCPVIVRVCDVKDKKLQKTKWHSDPFYTRDKGYRMCLRVIINGTSSGENTHISVFLYLMRGRYDGNLQWPLIGTFEITILNQKMDGEHYTNNPIKFTEKTPSGISSKVSAKQTDDMARDGLGRSEFISYEDLEKDTATHQYLKDDCMFIRVRQVPV